LTGWEGRNVVRVFPLIALSEGKLFFDGMTYEKAGTDGVRVYLAVGGQGRRTREVVFAYRRKRM
jgi:hypothetical protein